MLTEVHYDPMLPRLSTYALPYIPTTEQLRFLREILELTCSDSRFAEKAYAAILLLLAGGIEPLPPPLPDPVIVSLVPSTAVVGDPDFILSVHGSGFTATSVIHINGVSAPTTFVSDTQLTTPVDMGLVLAPVVAPITVVDSSVTSAPMDFTVTAPVLLSAQESVHSVDHTVKSKKEK
jgi:hypothetical protein